MPAVGNVVAGSASTTSGRNPATRRARAAESPAKPAPTTRMRKAIAASLRGGNGHESKPRHYRAPRRRGTHDHNARLICSRHRPARAPSVVAMAPTFNAIGIVVADMAASLAFYRRLGLAIPAEADDAPHAEAELPGGVRLMWDTLDTINSFDPEFSPAKGDGRIGL